MEDFVTFEIAKKLKEKGFREPCLGWYYPFEVCGFDYKTSIVFNNSAYRGSNYKDMLVSHKDEKYIDAPTISQVLKWLRDEKLILIGLSPMQEYDGDEIVEWCSTIYKADKQGGLSWQEELYYQSYEDAALAGIEYVLDNLI